MKAIEFTKRLIWMLGTALPVLCCAETITLENTKGAKIEADLISVDDTSVTFKRVGNDKTHTYPLASLSESTQAQLKEWSEANDGNHESSEKDSSLAKLSTKFAIEVFTGKTRKNSAMDDFDDKRVNLEPVITIKNEDSISTRSAKLTCLFLGRPVAERSATYVFTKESFDLPELGSHTSKDFNMKKVSAAYDSRGYSKFGSSYSGYIIIIHDEVSGEILGCRAVPGNLSSSAEEFLKLEAKFAYDKNFRKITLPAYID